MDVREKILVAGVTLLQEAGIAALTQPRVARAAGVKQSHLTYYFPKRADLLLGVAGRVIEALMEDLASRAPGVSSLEGLAQSFADAAAAGLAPRVMIGLMVAADADPAVRVPLRQMIASTRERIAAVLRSAGIEASAEAALLFHSTLVGLAILQEARRTEESAREAREGIAALLRRMSPASGAGTGADR